MIKEIGGVIKGSIRSPSNAPVLTGSVNSLGQQVIQNAEWGEIKGDIEKQEDLQTELHQRDNQALTVQEIEKLLYL